MSKRKRKKRPVEGYSTIDGSPRHGPPRAYRGGIPDDGCPKQRADAAFRAWFLDLLGEAGLDEAEHTLVEFSCRQLAEERDIHYTTAWREKERLAGSLGPAILAAAHRPVRTQSTDGPLLRRYLFNLRAAVVAKAAHEELERTGACLIDPETAEPVLPMTAEPPTAAGAANWYSALPGAWTVTAYVLRCGDVLLHRGDTLLAGWRDHGTGRWALAVVRRAEAGKCAAA